MSRLPLFSIGLADFGRWWGITVGRWALLRIDLPANERPPFRWRFLYRRPRWWEWPWIEREDVFLYVFNFVFRLVGRHA